MATPDELARLVQQDHTDEITLLEEALLARILGGTQRQFEKLTRKTMAAWTITFGGPFAPAIPGPALNRLLASVRSAVRRITGGLGERAQSLLADALIPVATVAARQAGEFVRAASGRPSRQGSVRPSRELRQRAGAVAAAVDDRVRRSLDALRAGAILRWSDVLTAMGTARGVVAAVQQHVATTVNEAVNETLAGTVRAVGFMRLWIAEADACVTCSAYAGLTVDSGRDFPGGLSWDPQQAVGRAPVVKSAPIHPRCRCRVLPWTPLWEVGEAPLPLALQRQARSNIAFGRARPSESQSARVRAAAELLRSGVDLPPDVRAAARRAVRNRRFAAA